MKYVQIVAACDMTRATEDQVVPAAETVFIAYGHDPAQLKVRELDLSDPWAKTLHEAMQSFLDASHDPGEMSAPAQDIAPRARANDPRVRTYNIAMRKWAREAGYCFTKLDKGGFYYPARTKQAYAHHLAGQDHLLTEEQGLQPDYDPETGNSV
jgi:hypothetical protein